MASRHMKTMLNITNYCGCCSVSKSYSSWPHELQHVRLPCPSLSPRICSNSCPLNGWCHPTISSSVTFFCPQSFPTSGCFLMKWPKYWNFSFSISPFSEYSRLISFKIDWSNLLAVQVFRVFSSTTIQKHLFFLWFSAFFMVQLSRTCMTTGFLGLWKCSGCYYNGG